MFLMTVLKFFTSTAVQVVMTVIAVFFLTLLTEYLIERYERLKRVRKYIIIASASAFATFVYSGLDFGFAFLNKPRFEIRAGPYGDENILGVHFKLNHGHLDDFTVIYPFEGKIIKFFHKTPTAFAQVEAYAVGSYLEISPDIEYINEYFELVLKDVWPYPYRKLVMFDFTYEPPPEKVVKRLPKYNTYWVIFSWSYKGIKKREIQSRFKKDDTVFKQYSNQNPGPFIDVGGFSLENEMDEDPNFLFKERRKTMYKRRLY